MNPATIAELIQLGVSVFTQIFNLFHHQSVPTSAAPALVQHLTSTPGITPAHVAVVTSSVNTAAKVADSVAAAK